MPDRQFCHNRSQNLNTGRLVALGLSALAITGALGSPAGPAHAWTKRQLAAQESHVACRAKIQEEPPCNQNWTRYCARQCHARYW